MANTKGTTAGHSGVSAATTALGGNGGGVSMPRAMAVLVARPPPVQVAVPDRYRQVDHHFHRRQRWHRVGLGFAGGNGGDSQIGSLPPNGNLGSYNLVVNQTGGNGGSKAWTYAVGGNGGTTSGGSSFNGSTTGTLKITQTATGGNGGTGSVGGIGGNGTAANGTFSSGSITVQTTAIGGTGGSGTNSRRRWRATATAFAMTRCLRRPSRGDRDRNCNWYAGGSFFGSAGNGIGGGSADAGRHREQQWPRYGQRHLHVDRR